MYGSSSQITSIQGIFVAGLFNQDGIKAKKVFLKNTIVYLTKRYLFHLWYKVPYHRSSHWRFSLKKDVL